MRAKNWAGISVGATLAVSLAFPASLPEGQAWAADAAVLACTDKGGESGACQQARPGKIPVIIIAGHDGTRKPGIAFDRIEGDLYSGYIAGDTVVPGSYVRSDMRSGDVALSAERELKAMGLDPFIVVSDVARHWVDMNRDPRSAYRHFRTEDRNGNPVDPGDGRQAWLDFHNAVEGYCKAARSMNQKVLLLDIHGKRGDDVHRGTLNGDAVADEHETALAKNFLAPIRDGFSEKRESFRTVVDDALGVLPKVEFTPEKDQFLDYKASEVDTRTEPHRSYRGGFNTSHFSVWGTPAYDYYSEANMPVWFERKPDGTGRLVTFENTYFLNTANPPRNRTPIVVAGGQAVKVTPREEDRGMELLSVDQKLTSKAGSNLYVDVTDQGKLANSALSKKVKEAMKDPSADVEYQAVFVRQDSACKADVVQLELGGPYRGHNSTIPMSSADTELAINTSGSVIANAVAKYHRVAQEGQAGTEPEPEASGESKPEPSSTGTPNSGVPSPGKSLEPTTTSTQFSKAVPGGSLAKTGAKVLQMTLICAVTVSAGALIIFWNRHRRQRT